MLAQHRHFEVIWLFALGITSSRMICASTAPCVDRELWSFCGSRSPSECLGNKKRLVGNSCNNPFENITYASAAPFFLDWDGDEDLDLVVGNVDGRLKYFERIDKSTLAPLDGEANPFQNIDVGEVAVPVFIDWDGDGDLDLVVGNKLGKLLYFERLDKSTLSECMDDANPFKSTSVPKFAAPAFVDWDGDADLDLAVGTTKGVAYFENDTDAWLQHTGSQNPFHHLRGTYRHLDGNRIVFADLNGDGKLDVVMGDWSRKVCYYERIDIHTLDASTRMCFDVRANNRPFNPTYPAVVDWDGDEDLDLVVGTTAKKLMYFESSDMPIAFLERDQTANPFVDIGVGNGAAPAFVDLDRDAVLELAVGSHLGTIEYWEYVNHKWSQRSGNANPFDGINVGKSARPVFVDWDGDDSMDLVVGNFDGDLKCYQQAQKNNSFLPVPSDDNTNPCRGIKVHSKAAPVFLDWDGDSDLDLVVGSNYVDPDSGADGWPLRYFECTNRSTWSERSGNRNPFDKVRGGNDPAFVDWDGDGDLDVLLGNRYYENTGEKDNHPWKLKPGPFDHIEWMDRSIFMDLDGDADLDMVVGKFDGVVKYYLNGCEMQLSCSSRGLCTPLGRCQCLNGYTGAHNSTWRADCGSCSPRFEASFASGALNCKICEPGRFAASVADSCEPCPAGSYAMQAADSCIECPKGKYSEANSSYCRECEAGKYVSTAGMDSCEPCPAGRYAMQAADSCSNCSGGKYSEANSSHCTECEAGKYASTGMESCMPCEAGEYSLRASLECSRCKAGTYSKARSSSVCSSCADDLYSSTGASACGTCDMFSQPSADNSRCTWDYWLLLCMIFSTIMQFYVFFTLFTSVCVNLRIADVSHSGDNVVITTLNKHPLTKRIFFKSWVVCISETFHPSLDGKRFRVRPLDHYRLELLDEAGGEITDDIQTSMGIMNLPLHHELSAYFHRYPACAVLLPAPWFLIIFDVTWSLPITMTIICSASCSALVGLLVKRYRVSVLTQLQARHRSYKKQILSNGYKPVRCESGPMRAVTLHNVRGLMVFFCDFIKDRNAYYLDSNIVKPITKDAKLSFAELVGPSLVTFFVSHFWGSPFVHFVESLELHAARHVRRCKCETPADACAYWICFLSNNQWHLDEEELGDCTKSSFYKALWSGSCRGTCMVLDINALPLSRAWCLFEVYQTFRREEQVFLGKDVESLIFCTHTGVMGAMNEEVENERVYDATMGLADRLVTLDVRDATASFISDEDMIKSLIESDGGMDKVNQFIRRNMCKALGEVQEGFSLRADHLKGQLTLAVGLAVPPDDTPTLPQRFPL